MKNGTTTLSFLVGNERSRTDVPHGTWKLSHGFDRRAMADHSQASAATFAPGGSPDGLSPRRHQRDLLCRAHRLCLALPAPRLSQMENRLRDLSWLAQGRNLAENPRFAPRQSTTPRESKDLAQCSDYRQSNRQNDRGGRGTRLRCRQETQWPQTAHRGRHAGTHPGRGRTSSEHPGLRWGGSGLAYPRTTQGEVSPTEGDLW